MHRSNLVFILLAMGVTTSLLASDPIADAKFVKIGNRYIDQFAEHSPIEATAIGDHRFDSRLNEVTDSARQARVDWLKDLSKQLDEVDVDQLSRENQVDHALLSSKLQSGLWRWSELREDRWNPLVYTSLAGDSIYGLMAREFAPLNTRLKNAGARLRAFPRFFEQVRATLDVAAVPSVHAKTAVTQTRGIRNTIDNLIRPRISELPASDQEQLRRDIADAEKAIETHAKWMESTVLPAAKGDFRIGIERFEQKLAYTLLSGLTPQQVRDQADRRVREVHAQMYDIAVELYRQQYPLTQFPSKPSDAFRRAVIRFGLEQAYAETPQAGEIAKAATDSVTKATDFLKKKDVITIFPDPLEIIVMPEFQRGVSLAYCDSPGPLETNQKTFYAVSPIPSGWTDEQIRSHLREYNTRSVDVLTIHEAMPGHFLQIAHSNRYPGKLRHLLRSGVFIEGWAVYTEWMMCEEGFLDDDPLLKLITLKWYLRDATNAILDHAIHVEGISRRDAMRLMIEDAFQEEREAAGKWIRAQLTSAQLSTYFVGYLEHVSIRKEAERVAGDSFDLKAYHDKVLSFGSPPPQYARALLLGEPIPRWRPIAGRSR